MKQLVLVLRADVKISFIKMVRYPVQTIVSILILYVLFVGLFYGSRSIAGVVDTPPAEFARSATEAIAGYLLWFFALMAIDSMGQNIAEEAQTGTLEQFYLSRWSFSLMMFFRFVSSMITSLVMIIPLLLLMVLSTGSSLDLGALVMALPIIGLTILGLCGLGYILGALTLLFKRIGNVMTLFQFGLLFLALSPIERLSPSLQFVALTLPLAQGVKLLRIALLNSGSYLVTADFLLLILNSVVYLVVGVLVFRWAEAVAKDKGLLGHY